MCDGLYFLVPAVHSVDLPERGNYSRVMVSIQLESRSAKSCKHSKIVLSFSALLEQSRVECGIQVASSQFLQLMFQQTRTQDLALERGRLRGRPLKRQKRDSYFNYLEKASS